MTICSHYFWYSKTVKSKKSSEMCALKEFTKSPKCFICSTHTLGVFNAAKDLMTRIQKRKERVHQQQEKIRQERARKEQEELLE